MTRVSFGDMGALTVDVMFELQERTEGADDFGLSFGPESKVSRLYDSGPHAPRP
jgi:hypothetical protein